MSSYATLDELKERLGSNSSPPGLYQQLTDRVELTHGDDAVGQTLIDEAESVMHAWLGRRFSVPVSVSGDATLAATLRNCALDLAVYQAWQTSPARSRMKETVKAAWDSKIAWLKAVAEGDAELPGAAALPASPSAAGRVQVSGAPLVFDDDAWN